MSHIRTIAALSEIRGEVGQLEELLSEIAHQDVDAIVAIGDLGAAWSGPETYRDIFRAFGAAGIPLFWVPGRTDAPLEEFLPEAFNLEIAIPTLHAVHGLVAQGPGNVLFAGMGGDIIDDPDTITLEESILRYAAWHVEYRLKVLREFHDRQKVLMFTTPPAHKGIGGQGSEVLAELIKTYNPMLAVVRGQTAAEHRLGKTVVLSPGRVDEGTYAIVDVTDHCRVDFHGPLGVTA
jgi:Icc-related predicted phosphoesterase